MTSPLLASVDLYCERIGVEFWAEPVNALTNVAFLAAALIGWRVARKAGRLDGPMSVLIALTASIGIGSFLFHTVARRWAALADVVPIGLFTVAYFSIVLRRFFGLPWAVAVPTGMALVPAGMALSAAIPTELASAVSGSTRYLPALVSLTVCGGLLAARGRAAGWALLLAAGVFVVSLTFRSIDAPLCEAMPIGTHFLWHLLNGVLLAWLLLTMVRYGHQP